MTFRSVVRSCGACVPEQVVSNDALAARLDTSDEWIRSRTGIRQRHVAAEGELTSDLATRAAGVALAKAGLEPGDLDLIVVATSTPDHTFPATATAVQRKLGAGRGMAFDVQAVCAGFPHAVTIADNFIRLGQARTALVIGAETFTRILDWTDRGTAVLFGDGAGALVLQGEPGAPTADERGIVATSLNADGQHYFELFVDGGPSSTGTSGHLRMNGQEVFRHAVANLASSVHTVLAQAGVALEQVDWLVPHQANRRIIDSVGKRLGIAPDRVVVAVDRHANTSAASIPLALALAAEDGRLQPGNLVALTAIGGGFAWGAVLLRW
ncbi:MAG: beta-ketoacyl-ACP synthase III [Pseudomonadota bacterium]